MSVDSPQSQWPEESLDRLCDRFEAAWRAAAPANPPDLIDFLPPTGVPGRAIYFRELLRLDLAYRYRAGTSQTEAEYRARFPEFAQEIDGAFRALDSSLVSASSPTAPPYEPTQPQPSGSKDFRTGVQTTGYTVQGVLGRGGMGVVYLARQHSFNRRVALKLLLNTADEVQARFRVEVEAVARLNHVGIVAVYDTGEFLHESGTLASYLAMEYCPGGTLAARLAGSPQPPGQAAALVELLARAVHAAHRDGVIHRDLKPSNVLFDVHGQPKIADFGLAKLLDGDNTLTQSRDLLGTPSYMAPEQAGEDARRVGPACDVYALGAILYECLTGRPPFKAATVLETLDQVRSHEPVPPRLLQPATPRDLDTICLKCLEKDPARRYASAAELADDLAAFREGRSIRARPTRAAEQVWRWARRRPALAGLYAVTLLAAVALLGLGFWFSAHLGAARAKLDAAHERLAAATAISEAAAARADAESIRAEAQHYVSLVSRARELIARPRPGWTWAALETLSEAAQLPEADAHQVEFLGDATECLTAVDVQPTQILAENLTPISLAWEPNGKRVAVGARTANILVPNCSVVLVDPADPKSTLTLLAPQHRVLAAKAVAPDHPVILAFSPDGRWLIAGMRSGMLHAWDLDQPTPTLTSWAGHDLNVVGLAFSREGRSLYTSGGRTVCRWIVGSWDKAASFTADNRVLEVNVHPSDGWLAVCGDSIQRLSANSLRPIGLPLPLAGGHVTFTPDKRCLLVERTGVVQTLALDSREVVRKLFSGPGHQGDLSDLALSKEGSLLLTASSDWDDRHARLWDLASGRLVAEVPTGGSGKVAFAPDAQSLAVSLENGVQIYEVRARREQTLAALHSEQPVQSFALAPDGRSLICEARLAVWYELTHWKLDDPTSVWRTERKSLIGQGTPTRLATSPTRGWLAFHSPGLATPLHLWHPNEGRTVGGEGLTECRQLRFGADGLLWGAVGEEVRVWDEALRPVAGYRHRGGLGTVLTGKPGVYTVAPGRRWTLAGGRDGSLAVLERADATLNQRLLSALTDSAVRSVALSQDEQTAAVGSDAGKLLLVRLPTGEKLLETEGHTDAVVAVEYSSTGLLASASRDGVVRVWLPEGRQLRELLVFRHNLPVRQMAFHADGVRLFVLLEGEWAVRVYHLDRLRERLKAMGLENGDRLPTQPVPLPPPSVSDPPPVVTENAKGPNGLKMELYSNAWHSGLRRVRYVAQVDFDWIQAPPAPELEQSAYSVRWTGWLRSPKVGRRVLLLEALPRGQLWLDGVLILDTNGGDAITEVELEDRPHEIRIDVPINLGKTWGRLSWAEVGGKPQVIESANLFHDRADAERHAPEAPRVRE